MNTQKDLMQLLTYEAETGIFRWKLFMGGRAPAANEVAGSLSKKGYVIICHKRKAYKAHRLAWLYVNGQLPIEEIDHINGKKDDNRITNLRCVSRSFNQQNLSKPQGKNNKYLGVVYDKYKSRFVAKIGVNKKLHHIGSFKTEEEARDAYIQAKRLMHPGGML